jgi:hypothetical protein
VRLGRPVAEFAAMAIAVVFSALPWLLALWVVVAVVRGSGDAVPERGPVTPVAHPLELLEEAVVQVEDGDLYVAVIRNRSRSRTALLVNPGGRFVDPPADPVGWPDDRPYVDNRPSPAPGQAGWCTTWSASPTESPRRSSRPGCASSPSWPPS